MDKMSKLRRRVLLACIQAMIDSDVRLRDIRPLSDGSGGFSYDDGEYFVLTRPEIDAVLRASGVEGEEPCNVRWLEAKDRMLSQVGMNWTYYKGHEFVVFETVWE